MLGEDTWKEVYAPRGYLAVEGDWIKRTAYGRTLEEVAKHGAGVFYNGPIADAMINKLESVNGVMTHKDVRPLPSSSLLKYTQLIGIVARIQSNCLPTHSSGLEQQNSLYDLGTLIGRNVTRDPQYP